MVQLRALISQKGQSVVELLVAVGLAAILLPALITGLVASREGRVMQEKRLVAAGLVREGEEATRIVRDRDWNMFAVNGVFHPEISGGRWSLATGTESATVDGLTRFITIENVYRNTSGAIDSSGIVDPSTKKVVVSVIFTSPKPTTVSSTMFLARLDNASYTETTQAQFDLGTTINVRTQLTSGSLTDGEIVLSQTGGLGDWCSPELSFTDLDLPKSGVANALSAIQGQAAAGTGENASGVSYANVKITDPAYPTAPVATIDGTFDGYKTNSVFTEQDYAYLGTDNNAKEVVIIDLTEKEENNKYEEDGYFNAPGNGNGDSVYTSGSVGYMTSGDKFYTFNLSDHTGSRPRLNSVDGLALAGTGLKITVVGSNAYVVTSGTTNQIQIINVTDPADPVITDNISVPGQGGRDVFVNVPQNRAYLVTAVDPGLNKPEFFLIDLANNSVKGSYDTHSHGDMNPKGVVAVSGGHAILVGTGGQEYQVLRLQSEGTPTWCGGLDVNSGINGVATVYTTAERAYSYIITGDASSEFKIIEGGPGAGGGGGGSGNYVPTGTFVSAPYGPIDPEVAFNGFVANVEQPTANEVQIQVAVADSVSGACANAQYTFVGKDTNGTGTGNYFSTSLPGVASISGAIPFGTYAPSYENPGKCFKYKVVLNTTDSTLTPVFNDITINHAF